jgi:hypothetical protein
MRPLTIFAVTTSAIAALALGACTSTTSILRSRFSKEHACPKSDVSVTELGGTTYVAKGCNLTAEYVCPSFVGTPGSDSGCVEQGLGAGAVKAPEQPRFVHPTQGDGLSNVPPPR